MVALHLWTLGAPIDFLERNVQGQLWKQQFQEFLSLAEEKGKVIIAVFTDVDALHLTFALC